MTQQKQLGRSKLFLCYLLALLSSNLKL